MRGGKNKQPLGYTIIEVMIVLAVSGVMFLIASTFVSGKQQRTSFNDGVNQMASQIQDVIEQVTDGRYSDISLTCTALPGVSVKAQPSVGPNEQGSNNSCIFVGKMIHFYGGSTAKNYETLSLADANKLPTTPAGDEYSSNIGAIAGLTTQQLIPQSLTLAHLTADSTSGSHILAVNKQSGVSATTLSIGFAQGEGTADPSGLGYTSGSQNIELLYGVGALRSNNPLIGNESSLQYPDFLLAKSATFCLTDGSEYATIDVGATDGNPFTVTVHNLGSGQC